MITHLLRAQTRGRLESLPQTLFQISVNSNMSRRRCALHCEGKSVFFSLPKVEAVKSQWLKFMFRTIPQQYSLNLVLCPRHFTDDCFINLNAYNARFASRLLLKEGSVSSLLGPASPSDESQPVSMSKNICCHVLCSMQNTLLVVCVCVCRVCSAQQ